LLTEEKKEEKPSEAVMNFFEKKTYNMKKADPTIISHHSV
jgi:hypothetical protein